MLAALWGIGLSACIVALTPAWMMIWVWAVVPENAPVVGVCFDRAWHSRAGISTKNYEFCLTRAGARIRELDPQSDDPFHVLDQIDALLLTGGGGDPERHR